MRKSSIVFFLVFISLTAYSQSDAEAIKILDRFSAVALGAPSVSMKFNLETVDQVEGTKNNVSGSIILSKDKYRLDMTNNIIWFNGETSWSYLPAEEEVTISRPDRKMIHSRPVHQLCFQFIKRVTRSGCLKKKPVHI